MLTCPNKCSSQSRILFSLQQHLTQAMVTLQGMADPEKSYKKIHMCCQTNNGRLTPQQAWAKNSIIKK